MGRTRPQSRDTALLVLSFLLLAGAGLDRMSMRPSRLASDYHARVRAAYEALPKDLGVWHGNVVPEPADAIDMLKPNVLLSRSYEDKSTDRRATFLLVQCTDVRDLISHYPPICYPNQGLAEMKEKRRQIPLMVGNLEVPCTEYTFESATLQDSRLTVVYNFMVIPDGRIQPDMDQAKKLISLDRRYFGLAQVQVVFDGKTPPKVREQTTRELVEAHMSLIEVILSGVNS